MSRRAHLFVGGGVEGGGNKLINNDNFYFAYPSARARLASCKPASHNHGVVTLPNQHDESTGDAPLGPIWVYVSGLLVCYY